MTEKLHEMLLQSSGGLRLPNYEIELIMLAKSARETYDLFIP
jgi:hypothetical protein